jgi:hypothetical protein
MTELFHFHPLLGAFAKLQRATVSFMPGHPSAWNISASSGQSFMKFDIRVFLVMCGENSSFIKTGQE